MNKISNKFNALIILFIIGTIIILTFTSCSNNGENIAQIKDLAVINEKGEYDQEAENQSNFIIILTNQSFENTKVNLTVYVDEIELINQECATENQHKGYYFYYNLEGTHEIKVISDDGQEVKEEITYENKPMWVMASYWTVEKGADLQLNIMDHPFLWD